MDRATAKEKNDVTLRADRTSPGVKCGISLADTTRVLAGTVFDGENATGLAGSPAVADNRQREDTAATSRCPNIRKEMLDPEPIFTI